MRPVDILVLSRSINVSDHLSAETVKSLQRITIESGRKQTSNKRTSSRNNKTQLKKTTFKKKAESFDDAMRMKIVADLNKLSESNYKAILEKIQSLFSRISDEQKPWVLRLIVENSTKQHMFARGYMQMFHDLTTPSKETQEMGKLILKEIVSAHESTITNTLSNGESYDDFCEANKIKVSRIGLSVVIGEACNLNMIPPSVVGEHALKLLKMMDTIRESASEHSRVEVENQTECVLQYFRTISKTKLTRDGFQNCIKGFDSLLETEKKDKKLNPKARFALMDFVDEMKKKHSEALKVLEAQKRNVYVPKRRLDK